MILSGDLKVDYYVTNRTELDVVLGYTAATLSGKVCFLEDGDYTGGSATRITLSKACTSYFLLIGRSRDVITPGWILTNSSYIALQKLSCSTEATNTTTSWSSDGVIVVQDTSNISIIDCEIASNSLATITMQQQGPSNYLQAYSGIINVTGTVTNLTIRDCYIHDVFLAVSVTNSTNVTVYGNYFENCYQSFGSYITNNLVFQFNTGYGVWANAGTDAGSPHSSLLGFAGTATYNGPHLIRGNILICGPNRALAYPGTIGVASGPKWNDTTGSALLYHDIECDHNIFVSTDNIGIQISLGYNFNVHHNLVAVDMDNMEVTTNAPSLYYTDITTSKAWNNITCSNSKGAVVTTEPDESWYADSYNNRTARAVGQGSVASGDLWSYPELFDGPTFTGVTPDNAVAKFTPISGSVFDGIGPIGTGFDFTTGSYVAPTYSKPTSTDTTGETLTQVQFGGAAYVRCTDVADPFIGCTDGDVISIVFVLDSDADASDRYVVQANGDAVSVRILPTNFVRFKLENSSGTAIVEIDSAFKLLAADGPTVWTLALKISTYEFFIMKGDIIDGLANVSIWKSGTWDININTLTFMGSASGTNIVTGGVQAFWFADAKLDLSTNAGVTSVVALDGLPANWGSDGKTLNAACKAYLAGDATAWNSDTLNLADAAYPFVMTGTVT